jgi:hypothetical protein
VTETNLSLPNKRVVSISRLDTQRSSKPEFLQQAGQLLPRGSKMFSS